MKETVKSKVKRIMSGSFGGLQKKERAREGGRRPERIEVSLFTVLVVWIWIKGWELRLLFEDIFLT